MNFEEFLTKVVPKVGPAGAYDLSRDARLKALETFLISKNIETEEEINQAVEQKLAAFAENILKMPPLPGNAPR